MSSWPAGSANRPGAGPTHPPSPIARPSPSGTPSSTGTRHSDVTTAARVRAGTPRTAIAPISCRRAATPCPTARKSTSQHSPASGETATGSSSRARPPWSSIRSSSDGTSVTRFGGSSVPASRRAASAIWPRMRGICSGVSASARRIASAWNRSCTCAMVWTVVRLVKIAAGCAPAPSGWSAAVQYGSSGSRASNIPTTVTTAGGPSSWISPPISTAGTSVTWSPTDRDVDVARSRGRAISRLATGQRPALNTTCWQNPSRPSSRCSPCARGSSGSPRTRISAVKTGSNEPSADIASACARCPDGDSLHSWKVTGIETISSRLLAVAACSAAAARSMESAKTGALTAAPVATIDNTSRDNACPHRVRICASSSAIIRPSGYACRGPIRRRLNRPPAPRSRRGPPSRRRRRGPAAGGNRAAVAGPSRR